MDRLAAGAVPGSLHSVGQAFSQDETIALGAVVEFAGPDVAPGPIEVNMQGSWHRQLSQETGNAGKIRIGLSRAVIALRVSSVVTEDGDWLFLLPEA